MWKQKRDVLSHDIPYGFSPLAGIRYVETNRTAVEGGLGECFSPLAGIRYVETFTKNEKKAARKMFQSPCGD